MHSHGGMIGSDAVINVTAANISTGGTLNALIDNSSGGTRSAEAPISRLISQAILPRRATRAFMIANNSGGTIGVGCRDQRKRGQYFNGRHSFCRDRKQQRWHDQWRRQSHFRSQRRSHHTAVTRASADNANGNIVEAGPHLNLTGDLTTQGNALLTIRDDWRERSGRMP